MLTISLVNKGISGVTFNFSMHTPATEALCTWLGGAGIFESPEIYSRKETIS